MAKVSFIIDKVPVDVRSAKNDFHRAIFEEMEKYVQRTLGTEKCPEHGQEPEVIYVGQDPTKLFPGVHACCDKMTRLVQAKLRI